ncbi:hypothetical protein H0O02_00425 [Candidatus Micrarchaeota archaeon]|nr:hypothetical protein [Candidatus Micrarchaeota archaeon]
MNKKWILLSLLFAMGLVFAIQPAEEWTVGATGRYASAANANVTTEGGNVTNVNLTGNVSTEKWAGYWGNVSGQIVLSPGTAMFYTWAWDSSDGGEVCAVAAPSGFNWATVTTVAVGVVDAAWAFVAGDADSATNTLTESCNVNIGGIPVTASAGETTGGGAFQTCAVSDGGVAKSDLAFCVNITQGGTLFNALTGDYQLLAPANETLGATETHYFWLELD